MVGLVAGAGACAAPSGESAVTTSSTAAAPTASVASASASATASASAPAAASASATGAVAPPLDLAQLLAAPAPSRGGELRDVAFFPPQVDVRTFPPLDRGAALPASAPWIYAPGDLRLRLPAGWKRAHAVGAWGVLVSKDQKARLLFTGIGDQKDLATYAQDLATIYRFDSVSWQHPVWTRLGVDLTAGVAIGRAVQDHTEYRAAWAVAWTDRPERVVLVLFVAPDAPRDRVAEAASAIGSLERVGSSATVCERYLVSVQRCLTKLAAMSERSIEERLGIRRDLLTDGEASLAELAASAPRAAVDKACGERVAALKQYACD
ncbi:MAG: hypothetical protein IT373_25040 [Polyangiaceae bacterium]|nr:hypothetical protein [Polyangiaceae bacterium]